MNAQLLDVFCQGGGIVLQLTRKGVVRSPLEGVLGPGFELFSHVRAARLFWMHSRSRSRILNSVTFRLPGGRPSVPPISARGAPSRYYRWTMSREGSGSR